MGRPPIPRIGVFTSVYHEDEFYSEEKGGEIDGSLSREMDAGVPPE
jgi:hypothetical protein